MKKSFMNYAGRDLICRSCRGVFYKTTDQFQPDRLISANMFAMIEPYKSQMWDEFPKDPDGTGGYGQLVCPSCGSEYADGNGFAIVKGVAVRSKPLNKLELAYLERERKQRFKPAVNEPAVLQVAAHECGYCKTIYRDPEAANNCLISCKEKANNGKN